MLSLGAAFLERLVVDPAEAAVAVSRAEDVEVVETARMRDAAGGAPQQSTLLVVAVAPALVAVRPAPLSKTHTQRPELSK